MLLRNLITSMWVHCFSLPFSAPSQKGAFLVLSLTPAMLSSWRPGSSSFPTIACHRSPLWVAVANSRWTKAGTATATAAATLTLLWLENLHKLLKVATGVLLGNISEGHFDASNSSLFLLRCLLFLFLVHPQTLVLINKLGFLMFRSLYLWRSFS